MIKQNALTTRKARETWKARVTRAKYQKIQLKSNKGFHSNQPLIKLELKKSTRGCNSHHQIYHQPILLHRLPLFNSLLSQLRTYHQASISYASYSLVILGEDPFIHYEMTKQKVQAPWKARVTRAKYQKIQLRSSSRLHSNQPLIKSGLRKSTRGCNNQIHRQIILLHRLPLLIHSFSIKDSLSFII